MFIDSIKLNKVELNYLILTKDKIELAETVYDSPVFDRVQEIEVNNMTWTRTRNPFQEKPQKWLFEILYKADNVFTSENKDQVYLGYAKPLDKGVAFGKAIKVEVYDGIQQRPWKTEDSYTTVNGILMKVVYSVNRYAIALNKEFMYRAPRFLYDFIIDEILSDRYEKGSVYIYSEDDNLIYRFYCEGLIREIKKYLLLGYNQADILYKLRNNLTLLGIYHDV